MNGIFVESTNVLTELTKLSGFCETDFNAIKSSLRWDPARSVCIFSMDFIFDFISGTSRSSVITGAIRVGE